jgi:hypothetical protein
MTKLAISMTKLGSSMTKPGISMAKLSSSMTKPGISMTKLGLSIPELGLSCRGILWPQRAPRTQRENVSLCALGALCG